MKEVKIKQNTTFSTHHSRDYYRGKSFHFAGKWMPGVHYTSDDYNIDFVVRGQTFLACAKSHLSMLDNEPTEFIKDERGTAVGIVSPYWDFVLTGVVGKSPGIKLVDNYWLICDDVLVPEEEQHWINSGVKARIDFGDLTEEDKQQVKELGQEVVNDFVSNVIVQETGDNEDKILSQKAISTLLESVSLNLQELNSAPKIEIGTTTYWNNRGSYQPDWGNIIIYSDRYTIEENGETKNIPGIKIGSGNAFIADLMFVDDKLVQDLLAHEQDTVKHITAEERTTWNNKINIYEPENGITNETLIFNRE